MRENMDITMQALWASSQLDGENAAYLEDLYEAFLADPLSIPESWRNYFSTLPGEARDVASSPIRDKFINYAPVLSSPATQSPTQYANVMSLVHAYRSHGHQAAKTNPLILDTSKIPEVPALTLEFHGLKAQDLESVFDIPQFFRKTPLSLKSLIQDLKNIYCGPIGTEYMHISDMTERAWIRDRLESPEMLDFGFSKDRQQWLLQRLVAADGLEKYLGMKYTGQKRFSLEGGDALIPLMDYWVTTSCDQGVKEMVIGMAHRGRLNILVNLMGKSPEDLFAEFEGKHEKQLLSGDVKYHNGFSSDKQTAGGKIHLVLGFNPSHLESVNPVVMGSVRARQDRRGQVDPVLGVLVHGDAAFAGQGVVMETLNMSQLRGYGTGGTLHVVINNQVGFTTSNPKDARSSRYCTDLAKMIEAPIFHVNGNDAEAVLKTAELAWAYRRAFHKDVVIDLVCYRLHGHNESDEPSGTQPLMYQVIKQLDPPYKIYAQQLIAQNIIDPGLLDQQVQAYKASLEKGASVGNLISPDENKKFIVDWTPYLHQVWDQPVKTSVDLLQIRELGRRMNQLPEGFLLQRQVAKAMSDRLEMTEGKQPLNWGYGEVMAYATLLAEGYDIRLSGEDVGRGTFSHRHAVLHDQSTDQLYIPLQQVSDHQGRCDIHDSLLSEEGVVGFEYGYAGSAPNTLVIWEAQFGDFANMAQPVIDQFITSGEEKWGRLCGLTLFLPHGQEGMGAEHSSARLERFLQLCAHDNIQVCVPTTPAQHFHLIRRQMIRPFRKPLVVMTPKSLLRHPLVISRLEDLTQGSFKTVLSEQELTDLSKITRVILCQGKVYYDLLTQRREKNLMNVAIIRLEQLYPFPFDALKDALKPYANIQEILWVQEEPKNQGAWFAIQESLMQQIKPHQMLRYVGRDAFASPAVGYPSLFHEQQDGLVSEALGV